MEYPLTPLPDLPRAEVRYCEAHSELRLAVCTREQGHADGIHVAHGAEREVLYAWVTTVAPIEQADEITDLVTYLLENPELAVKVHERLEEVFTE
jgi:hypothetical protein